MMKAAARIILIAALAFGFAARAWPDELTETPESFAVTIGGNALSLDGLVIKKSDAQGRLPVVLFTNGGQTTATAGTGATTTVATYAPYARDLARRGWLAAVVLRRGFGKSDGPKPTPIACQADSFNAWATAAADDLQATIDFIAKRPDADASKVMVIGSEIAGVAAVALSARNPPGLVGVISISGGLQSEVKCPMQDILVDAFRDYGTRSRVPNLWFYSKSDKIFDPDFADRLHSAFLDGGGDVKFFMFYRAGNVGTPIFSKAVRTWYAQMDGFLQLGDLPTWSGADAEGVLAKLAITDAVEREHLLEFLKLYLIANGEKALVFSPSIQKAWVKTENNVVAQPPLPVWDFNGAATMGEARKQALADCQKKAQDCAIVMENSRWVGGLQ